MPDVGQGLHQVVEGGTGQQGLQDGVHKAPIRPGNKSKLGKVSL